MHDLTDLSETLNNCNQGLEAQQFTINWNWKSICNSYTIFLFFCLFQDRLIAIIDSKICAAKSHEKRGKLFATKGISCFLT